MKQSFHMTTHRSLKAGFALVIVLGIIVLLTVLIVTFFSQTVRNRVTESSRTNRSEADLIARSGLDHVTARLVRDAVQSADRVEFGPADQVFQAPDGAANFPPRSVAPAVAGAGFEPLIRQSIAAADPLASTDSTSALSANGRSVSPQRWNMPVLLPGQGFAADNQAPNWIYVDRDNVGNNTLTAGSVGRFAYNAYWIGGLLDANVAGHPTTLTAAQRVQLAGPVAYADLTALPGVTAPAVDSLIAVRNPAITSTAEFVDMARRGTREGWNSHRIPADGGAPEILNSFFSSRQDLIRFAREEVPSLQGALPFLTHFSRTMDTPVLNPTITAPLENYYASTRPPNTGAVNPFAAGLRPGTSFTRPDGTTAAAGDPLLARPFALNRLKGLSKDGIDATAPSTLVNGELVPASADTIRRDFGLAWNAADAAWNYVGPTGSVVQTAIPTLEQVAQESREPNFVELLKASILWRSLGKSGGNTAAHTAARDAFSDIQIMQIAANIIDQYDADSVPTRILFAGLDDIIGVENLPLLYGINQVIYRRAQDVGSRIDPFIGGWFQPILWNPHQNAPASYSGLQFRFTAQGNVRFVWEKAPGFFRNESPIRTLDADTGAVFPNNAVSYADPTILYRLTQQGEPTGDLCKIDELAQWNDNGTARSRFVKFGGIFAAEVDAADSRSRNNAVFQAPGVGVDGNGSAAFIDVSAGVTFRLEVDDGSGWRLASIIGNTRAGPAQSSPPVGGVNYPPNGLYTLPSDYLGMWGRIDPRTQRFGLGIGQNWVMNGRFFNLFTLATPITDALASPKPAGGTYSLGVIYFNEASGGAPRVSGAGFFPEPGAQGTAYQLAAMADNLPGDPPGNTGPLGGRTAQSPSGLYYDDNDGQRRRAEGAYAPFESNNRPRLPVVLNRPFQTVAELGFAHRDLPWKNLDFFTAESADAFLLDVFSIEEQPVSARGGVSPNGMPPEVAESLFVGTAKDLLSAANVITTTEAASLGSAYSAALRTNPATSKGSIVHRFASNPAIVFPGNEISATRESIFRALSPVDNARTWNVLIDVVGQAGQRTPNGGFMVHGEQRYWLAVSIDRVTGRVIDSRLEKVEE